MHSTLARPRPVATPAPRFSMDMDAPFRVYNNGVIVGQHDSEQAAGEHFHRLRRRAGQAADGTTLKPESIDRVTQNADGEWMLDCEIVRCSLGGHEGLARHRLMVKQFHEADAVGRERLLKEWS